MKFNIKLTMASLAAAAASLLAACGGGGGGATTAPTTPPTAGGSVFTAQCATGGTATSTVSLADAQARCPAGAELVTSVPATTYVAGSQEKAAFDFVNQERSRCGFGLLAQSTRLDQSARNHNQYQLMNNVTSHDQVSTGSSFTGARVANRLDYVGYQLQAGITNHTEVIASGYLTTGTTMTGRSVRDINRLLSAPYHALGLLSNMREIGFSTLASSDIGAIPALGNRIVTTADFGIPSGSTAQLIPAGVVATYPCEGTTGTEYELRNEEPNPVPGRNLLVNPIGMPTMVMARPGSNLQITTATYSVQATSATVALLPFLTPLNDASGSLTYIGGSNAVIMPNVALLPNTVYVRTINGTLNGVAFTKTERFTTRP